MVGSVSGLCNLGRLPEATSRVDVAVNQHASLALSLVGWPYGRWLAVCIHNDLPLVAVRRAHERNRRMPLGRLVDGRAAVAVRRLVLWRWKVFVQDCDSAVQRPRCSLQPKFAISHCQLFSAPFGDLEKAESGLIDSSLDARLLSQLLPVAALPGIVASGARPKKTDRALARCQRKQKQQFFHESVCAACACSTTL